MDDERDRFLHFVVDYVARDPEAAPLVVQAASHGLHEALRCLAQRAADMETALAVSLAKRHKGADALIHDTLKKWEGKTALNWAALQPDA
jgi:hypothetical protein